MVKSARGDSPHKDLEEGTELRELLVSGAGAPARLGRPGRVRV